MWCGKSLLFAVTLFLPAFGYGGELGLLRLSLIEGNAQVMNQDSGSEWTSASINLPLAEGDRFWVPDGGRVEIQVRGGEYVRADENSALDVLSISGDAAQFYMDHGHLYINNGNSGIRTVQIDTPLSSIRSYDNSIMTLDVHEGGATELQVLKGDVYAENKEGKTRITPGNALTIREDGSAELAPIGTPDDWEAWNIDRDRQVAAWGESSRYLPDTLHEYSSDFDANGRWIHASDYGYVWSPFVVEADWSPYRVGHWKWIRGQYVWISHEPWGWAPYHYGRWAFVIGTGWCWVPPPVRDVFWGPGYVGWVNTPAYVGWVPLAPGEIYYGYGFYGSLSVNLGAVQVNTIVFRPYRNVHVHNSVTVVHRDTFGTPRRSPVKLKENPFLQQRPNFLPPSSKPERRTVIRQSVETQKLPPERIQRIRPDEIRSQRRLVKEREASVFRPDRPQQQLQFKSVKEPKVIIRKPRQAVPVAPEDQKKRQRQERRHPDRR